MKRSKYNVFLEIDNSFYIFNQLSSAFFEIDEQLFLTLQNEDLSLDSIEKEDTDFLWESNFLCDKDLIEENVLLQRNRIYRYGNRIARITIMPTLNCNFKCWYCYESHFESKMDADTLEAAILFIKNIVRKNRLQSLHLDWFGGEPLLYFEEIMYPIAKELLLFCEEENVQFIHGITTNGYLINADVIQKMKEIKLATFQITLDGSAHFHNKTRFSKTDRQTYNTIVSNIENLCKEIENIFMTLRINYTPQNISTIDEIADSFSINVRKKIKIMPQIVWQYKKDINSVTDNISQKLIVFSDKGYNINNASLPTASSASCYVESMFQFVINYNGDLYKCTARDFNEKNKVGQISSEGLMAPTANYYKYFTCSYFENPECLACKLLPSCFGMCLQKKVENGIPKCPKDAVSDSITNQLKLFLRERKKSI
jgi:uncharacterized protein